MLKSRFKQSSCYNILCLLDQLRDEFDPDSAPIPRFNSIRKLRKYLRREHGIYRPRHKWVWVVSIHAGEDGWCVQMVTTHERRARREFDSYGPRKPSHANLEAPGHYGRSIELCSSHSVFYKWGYTLQ